MRGGSFYTPSSMRRIFGLTLLLVFISAAPRAESSDRESPADVLYLGPLFWNALVWYPQMAAGVEFAQVTPEDWKEHLTHPWVWDNDEFSVNQIGHPYQGSLPYTTSRAGGWDFSASLSSVLLGSLTWELFMENETPSKNDFIVTTAGGASLGEMLFRLSEAVRPAPGDSSGVVAGNLAAGALSPGGTLGRIVYGPSADDSLRSVPLRITLGSFGGVDLLPGEPAGGMVTVPLDLRYGERPGEGFVPFDIFSLRAGLGGDAGDFYAYFFSEGLLAGTPLYRRNGDEDILGCFLHYDFIYNDIMNLSANSLGIGWVSGLENLFDGGEGAFRELHLSLVLNGGAECLPLKMEDLLHGEPEEERRSYDMGVGVNFKGACEFPLGLRAALRVRENYYFLYLYPSAVPEGGSAGSVHRNILEAGLRFRVNPLWSLEGTFSWGAGLSDYSDLPDVSGRVLGFRLGINYRVL